MFTRVLTYIRRLARYRFAMSIFITCALVVVLKHGLVAMEMSPQNDDRPVRYIGKAQLSLKPQVKQERVVSSVTADDEYKRRQKVALNACVEKRNSDWLEHWPRVKDEPRFSNSPMISTKNNLFFCPVGKVASSFFTRWVLAMNKPGPMTSPYDIAMRNAGRNRAESLNKLSPKRKKIDFLNKAKRIVFGRNPYSRIFSAYVDKLFSPNPTYWRAWGKPAMKLDNNSSMTRGADVSFPQFVNAVVKKISKIDVHLKPVAHECNVCQMPYDVVGKLENTVEDLDYASSLLNISSSFQHQPGYKRTAQKDIILDSVHSAFSWKNSIKQCGVSTDEMGKRMWRKLQIRGVIDSSLEYPFNPGAIDSMPAAKFIQKCDDAISKSTNKTRLRKQRTLAMELAYATVPEKLIQEIQLVYDLDFAYFEYPKQANFMTKRATDDTVNENSIIFQWDKLWNVV